MASAQTDRDRQAQTRPLSLLLAMRKVPGFKGTNGIAKAYLPPVYEVRRVATSPASPDYSHYLGTTVATADHVGCTHALLGSSAGSGSSEVFWYDLFTCDDIFFSFSFFSSRSMMAIEKGASVAFLDVMIGALL